MKSFLSVNINKLISRNAIMASLLLMACQSGPEPISYGKDNCRHCKMIISDNRYGSEVVTKKGKVYKFDSVECLASYLHEHTDTEAQLLLVTDFNNPGTFIETSQARFLQSEQLPSPMGMNLTALAGEDAARQLAGEKGGEVLTWETVRKISASHSHANH
jgi:copper chaperone NosL